MGLEVVLDGLFLQNESYDYDDAYENNDSDSKGSRVLIVVLYAVEIVVGVLGYGLLLAVLAQRRRSWTISDTFVLHQSVADILLLFTLPFWAATAAQSGGWHSGDFLCKISSALFNINFYCGITLLICIILDRYLSIIHATQLFSQQRPSLVHISCLLVWFISIVLAIPDWIFMAAWKDPEQSKTLCVHSYSHSATDWRLMSRLHHHILGLLLPIASLIICCSSIILWLQRRSRGLQTQRPIIVILSLVGVFFLCWMPYNITLIVDTIRGSSAGPHDDSLETALNVTFSLGCVHACLRPLLYFGLCANFRRQILAILRCATVESESSLWELGVGEAALPDQSHVNGEQEQMTSVVHQEQLTPCC